mgnify:CR=1 FL=1
MPRKASEPPTWQAPPGHETITLHLKLITPMFGGGYETRHVDEVMPIRPAAIRGHLRFWWRATAGANYNTPQELFRAEEAIWGSMEKPGKVRIHVLDATCGVPVVWARFEKNPKNPDKYKGLATQLKHQWPRYALEIAPDTAIEAGTLTLRLRLPHGLQAEVLATLAAWVCYGGIGARTRRGCGSLTVIGNTGPGLPEPQSPSHANGLLTTISGMRRVLGPETSDPIVAWKQAVDVYAAFRQMRYPGHPPMPGRSKWPEPDSIRRIENSGPYTHTPKHAVRIGFPRADLGLPIVFHFKDSGDPNEHTLQAAKERRTRLASPVITKAIAMPNGKYRPLVAVLNAPHAWALGPLDLEGTKVDKERIELTPTERSACEPLKGRDVRSALLEHAQMKWSSKIEVLP